MNGPHTPVFMRENRFTRLMDRIAEQNAADGKPAGRSTEQFMNAQPLIPASRVARMSKAEARRTDFVPEPDDPQAAMMASARASAMGIQNFNTPTYDDDMPSDIGHVASDPSDAEIDQMLARAREVGPGIQVAAEGAAGPAPHAGPAPAGRPVALPRGTAPTQMGVARQMPNFANVEGFDLTRKVAVVDGMEFRLADVDVVAMKKFAIQVVLDNVTFQLAEALVALGIPAEVAQTTADKMRETVELTAEAKNDEAVQPVQDGEDTRRVLPESSESRRSSALVSGVQENVETIASRESEHQTLRTEVHVDGKGSSKQLAEMGVRFRASDDVSYLTGDGEVTPE